MIYFYNDYSEVNLCSLAFIWQLWALQPGAESQLAVKCWVKLFVQNTEAQTPSSLAYMRFIHLKCSGPPILKQNHHNFSCTKNTRNHIMPLPVSNSPNKKSLRINLLQFSQLIALPKFQRSPNGKSLSNRKISHFCQQLNCNSISIKARKTSALLRECQIQYAIKDVLRVFLPPEFFFKPGSKTLI